MGKSLGVGVLVLLLAVLAFWKLRGSGGDAAGELAGSAARGGTAGGVAHGAPVEVMLVGVRW